MWSEKWAQKQEMKVRYLYGKTWRKHSEKGRTAEWEARILTGYKENGKAQYKYLYGKSYREVKEKKIIS